MEAARQPHVGPQLPGKTSEVQKLQLNDQVQRGKQRRLDKIVTLQPRKWKIGEKGILKIFKIMKTA